MRGRRGPTFQKLLPLVLTAGALAPRAEVAHAQSVPRPSRSSSLSLSPDTVSILILSGEQAGVALSEVYTAARRGLERHTALRVAPLDAIGLAERQAAIRECAGKAACFAEKVRGIANTAFLLMVSVDRAGDAFLLGLRLIETQTERELGAFGDEIPAGMSLPGVMERTLPKVFPDTVWGQVGDVVIHTEPSNAEVFVGQRSCASPCTIKRLTPGAYAVSVRKSGFDPWQGAVEVASGQTAHLRAELVEPSGGILSNPWFWTGVTAAVVAAAVTSFLVLSDDGGPQMICVAPTRADCDL